MSEMKANCFVCNVELVLGWDASFNYEEKLNNPAESLMANISAGYTSRFDGAYGKIYVCDDCFGDRIERVVHLGDYFDSSPDAEIIEEAEEVINFAAAKFRHPSNKGFWNKIQEKYWEGQ